jgi:hypothetical protein
MHIIANLIVAFSTVSYLVRTWRNIGLPLVSASPFWWGLIGIAIFNTIGIRLLRINNPLPPFPESLAELAWAFLGAVWAFCGLAMIMVSNDPGLLLVPTAQVLFGISLAQAPWVLCYLFCTIAYNARRSLAASGNSPVR